jgi:AcrR family transcriptional regulator
MPPTSAPARTDGRAARWAGQQERRRSEFVDAALRAIAKHGPDVSTEQIAAEAGVARTRIYKHFTDAADLQGAIAERALELIASQLQPLWNPQGSPLQMISAIIETLVGLLSENRHLYRYLTTYGPSTRSSDRDVVTDVKTIIGNHVTAMFTHYLTQFGADTRMAEPGAFALVGLVEGTISRWLDNPAGLPRDELAGQLTRWIWLLIDQVLRDNGIDLDPDAPLAAPDLVPPGPAQAARR